MAAIFAEGRLRLEPCHALRNQAQLMIAPSAAPSRRRADALSPQIAARPGQARLLYCAVPCPCPCPCPCQCPCQCRPGSGRVRLGSVPTLYYVLHDSPSWCN
ncbi:hypothetical protein M758_9G014600 [Ceratodon purpureus]|nr:hypothetical protein M758_9G014600 [Ceratodon purpureus]